jgi:hypothetical protein
MEHEPHNDGLPTDEVPVAERERRINDALEDAQRKGRRIDDLTAKHIARELDPGSGALHAFVETGAIADEADADLVSATEVLMDLELTREPYNPWITALGEYFNGRLIKSELPYWNDEYME